jgi:general secretion pathway protein G
MLQRIKSIQERRAVSGDEGFTLIELLIVIVVLGILAAVVVFALGSVTGNAKKSACNADAKEVVTAVQAYNAQNAPAIIGPETGITLGSANTYGTGSQATLLTGATPPYLNAWPNNNGYAVSLATAAQIAGTGGLVATAPNAAAGDPIVYVPATAALGVDYNSQAASGALGGCNQL